MAIVTGAGRGIGSAVALRLAAEGSAVAVNYATSADGTQRVLETTPNAAARAVAIQADFSRASHAKHLIDSAADQLGAPLVLVDKKVRLHRRSISSQILSTSWLR